MNRVYFKCRDCLEVAVIETEERAVAGMMPGTRCDCGGNLFVMGQVCGTRIVVDGFKCPCDARCTHANGPDCECPCKGVNHGTGKVVPVVWDMGTARLKPRCDLAKRIRMVEDFRNAVLQAKQRADRETGGALSRLKSGSWTDNKGQWWKAKTANDAINRAQVMKSHSARMKALAAVCPPPPVATIAAASPMIRIDEPARNQSLLFA